MAKQIACPNCGAPASIQPLVREQKCEWCNSAFVLNDHGAALLGGSTTAAALMDTKHAEADLKAQHRQALAALEAHSKLPSHRPAPEVPRWLRRARRMIGVGMLLVVLVMLTVLGVDIVGAAGDSSYQIGSGPWLGLLGGLLLVSLAVLRGSLVDLGKKTFVPTPLPDWHLTRLRLALEAERAADLLGLAFAWPAGLDRSPAAITARCEGEERQANEATATLPRIAKRRIAAGAAVFLTLVVMSLVVLCLDRS